jgi:hypothetical protein
MTEFVLVDRDGRSREYFDTRDEAIEHLCAEEEASPGLTAGWMLQPYEDDGMAGEPEWAEDLCRPAEPAAALPGARACAHERSGYAVAALWRKDELGAALLKGDSSETPPTIPPASPHPQRLAIGMIGPQAGETGLS